MRYKSQLDPFIRFRTIPASDRQTDRQTDRHKYRTTANAALEERRQGKIFLRRVRSSFTEIAACQRTGIIDSTVDILPLISWLMPVLQRLTSQRRRQLCDFHRHISSALVEREIVAVIKAR